MITSLRPTLTESNEPGLTYSQTYFRVMQAVANCRSLIHGRLELNGQTCALGAYFRECSIPISAKAIEEIAAYNDSFPRLCPNQRWRKVNQWLKEQAKAKLGK